MTEETRLDGGVKDLAAVYENWKKNKDHVPNFEAYGYEQKQLKKFTPKSKFCS